MIKNVRELNGEEIVSLKAAYKKNFEEYAAFPIEGVLSKIHRFTTKNSSFSEDEMLEKILSDDDRIGLVDIDNSVVKALITGILNEDGAALISHFYIDKNIPDNNRRSVTLEIFKSFLKVLKDNNAKSIQTDTSFYVPKEKLEEAVLYERHI